MGLPETLGRSMAHNMKHGARYVSGERDPLYAWWRGMGDMMEVPNAAEPRPGLETDVAHRISFLCRRSAPASTHERAMAMIDLKMDEQAEIRCRWCGNSLRAVRISQSGPLPLDVAEFLLNRHRESHPSLMVEGGDWLLAERCPVRHDGEPLLPDRNLWAATLPGGDAIHDSGATPGTDREALSRFFEATDGENWKKKGNWGTEGSLAEWAGVRVSKSSGRVITLILENNSVYGRIPPELGRLTELTNLNLGGNHLGWEIPGELGSLSKLKRLNLRGNRLRGEIPAALWRMGSLTHLYLEDNRLEGEIPAGLGQLRKLVNLHLNNNLLEGGIPAELGAMESLRQLRLNGNKLKGRIPPQLEFPGKLTEGDLNNNLEEERDAGSTAERASM